MGYEIIVLTVQAKWIRYPKDIELLKELPDSVKVIRSFFPDPNWLFKLLYGLKLSKVVSYLRKRVFVPDPEILWRPSASIKLKQILRQNPDISVAIISSGPPSALALGLILKRKYNIPYICDFRDEWTNNPERINLDASAHAQSKEIDQELKIMESCSGVVYLTELMKKNFQSRYPFLSSIPNAVISNGYDESDFIGLTPTNNKDRFHLVYSGSFYDRRQPDSLWQALLTLIQNKQLNTNSIQVDIYGKNTVSFVLGRYSQNEIIQKIVHFHPFRSHRQSLGDLMSADALLLYIPSGINAQSVLTGKIFDYLRSGKPILAIAPPDGIAAELVTRAGTGFVADYMDIEGITAQVLKLYGMWQEKKLDTIQPDLDYIASFSRRKLAERHANLIEEVTS